MVWQEGRRRGRRPPVCLTPNCFEGMRVSHSRRFEGMQVGCPGWSKRLRRCDPHLALERYLAACHVPCLTRCSILMRLLRRNSMAALELHVTARGVESSEGGAEKEKEKDVVATRSGVWGGVNMIVRHAAA